MLEFGNLVLIYLGVRDEYLLLWRMVAGVVLDVRRSLLL